MKIDTKCQCPDCGSFSTVNFDNLWIECLNCRRINYTDDPIPDSFWDFDPEPAAPCSDHACFATDYPSPVLRNFRTICGISPRVEVTVEIYSMGGLALQLWNHEGPLAVPTHWVPGIPAGCVAVRDFDENRGILPQLIQHGVLEPPHMFLDGLSVCRFGRLLQSTSSPQLQGTPSNRSAT